MTQYYIERQASGYVGNCLLFWKKNGAGYSCDLDQAEVFDGDSEDFRDIMCHSKKYRAWPKDHIDKCCRRHADHQGLNLDFAMKSGS